MVFSSLIFIFAFLPVTLALYYLVPFKAKNVVLLLCSLVFYAWGEPVYVVLMILNIAFNYVAGLDISMNADNLKRKRAALILCMVFDLGLLGFFKYAGFVVDNINVLFGCDIPFRAVGLPVGISFYTFQVMSYIIDVYKGEIKAQKNPLTLGVYVTMFPQLIAGPIVQYSDVEKQLAQRVISRELFSSGVSRFIVGLSKKVILANSAGSLFDTLSALETGDMSVLTGWLLAASYTFQIYFDFSGYSDMAIGLGKMLGFEFKENFNYPYMSKSASEFWRRWHISLSSWFRDYVYIPLGGSYVEKKKHIRNIMVVWMLTGLWHGASWTFIIWGLYYGVLLIFEKYFLLKIVSEDSRGIKGALLHVYTIVVFVVGWVIFSSPNMHAAGKIISVMFGFGASSFIDGTGMYYLQANALLGAIMILGSTSYVKSFAQRFMLVFKDPVAYRAAACVMTAFLLISVAYLVNETYNPFLYFRF